MSETDKAVYLQTVAELRNIERRHQSLQAEHARCAERFAAKDERITAQDAEIKRLRNALEHPSAHTHCCFCGTYNPDDPKGYAGERSCHACGHGGQGEGNLLHMASDAWNNRPAALATPAPEQAQKEQHNG